MSIDEHKYRSYTKAVEDAESAGQAVLAIPQLAGYSTSGLEKHPAGITTVAQLALTNGRAKADEARGACIANSVSSWKNSNTNLLNSLLNPQPVVSPPAPIPTMPINIFIPTLTIPELSFLDQLAAWCLRRSEYFVKLSTAAQKWEDWTNEIRDFYTTKLVKQKGDDLAPIDRGIEGKRHSIKRDNLAAYFTEIAKTSLYSNKNETSTAVEEKKKKIATGGGKLVVEVVNSAEKNHFYNASLAAKNKSTEFYNAAQSIHSCRNALSDYIASVSSCSVTVTFNPVSGSYGS